MTSPADIFLACWLHVRRALGSHRTAAPPCLPADMDRIDEALRNEREVDVGIALNAILADSADAAEQYQIGLRLRLMERVDQAFASIHPRLFQADDDSSIPDWLQVARDRRRDTGVFGSCADVHDADRVPNGKILVLIARGPLLRRQRDADASYAENLADRFAFLSVAQDTYVVAQTSIKARYSVIGEHYGTGVYPSDEPAGLERVTAAPIADDRAQLSLRSSVRHNKRYVSIEPAAHFDPSAELLGALKAFGKTDIAVAPEFVMSPKAHETVLEALKESTFECRFLLAGTANTAEPDAVGQPWNEAVVSNSCGIELWRQRKLWPSQLDPDRAAKYGLTENDGDGHFHEDIASGDVIEIVDVDSLGRCVILICQDIVSEMARALIIDIQPDWVFVPIMDRGFAEKSWFINKTQRLNDVSKARFVGVCSTALPRDDGQTVYCLNIICPEDGDEFTPSRVFSFKEAQGSPGAAVHHFGKTEWETFSSVRVNVSADRMKKS